MTNTQQWLTKAERTNFQETSRYAEDIEFCGRLEKASSYVRFTNFGKSPEGRELPLLIISRDKVFTPEQARQSDSAIILINNGIHAGEISGKEATYMLLREILITKKLEALLNHLILLVIPVFSVDGHERVSPYNRINQNGPVEMGWRTSATNLNLNRDWMKAEQPEMRAMLDLFYKWLPDFVIDNHVSDGADFQYDITWVVDDHFALAKPVSKYFRNQFEPRLIQDMNTRGHKVRQYFEMIDATDPSKGITPGPFEPRFCTGFCTLENRPALTTESHALKDFRTQTIAHYDLMEAALQQFSTDPAALRNAVRTADHEAMQLQSDYPIRLRVDRSVSEPIEFHGVEFTRETSSVSGVTKVMYGSTPIEITVPYYRHIVPDLTVRPPVAYVIPQQWTQIISRLEAHHIEFSRLGKEITGVFETYRFTNVSWDPTPFEGHHRVHFESHLVTEQRTLPAGSLVVRLNQRSNKVILGLLEPDAPDSVISWGYLDMIFEDKEYGENYIIEKMALEMLEQSDSIREEFQRKLMTDPEFAASPDARLRFFYERSPYRDERKNAYPVVRITELSQLQ